MHALLLGSLLALAPQDTKVACLGDSITFGAQVAERERNCYPAQLGYLLGEGFEVRNFGVGGATLLRRADRPYVEQAEFDQVLAWAPDVALCILGTNDSVLSERGNWSHADDLEVDARALVADLQRTRPDMRIVLGSPTPIFPEGQDAERASDLTERAPRLARVGEALRSVAAELPGVDFVDLSDVLEVHHVTDGVHTTPFGASAIAERMHAVLGPHVGYSPTTWPRPSAEYRGAAAGWGQGTWWEAFDRLRELGERTPDTAVAFLGDSITQGLTGSADRLAVEGGTRPIDRTFGERGAVGLGLSGDRTEHLLWRIERGALVHMAPEVVVLQIGINNLVAAGHSGEQTARGLNAVVDALLTNEPQADIVLCGPFPAGRSSEDPVRANIQTVHDEAAVLARRARVHHLDLRHLFLHENGSPNERMAGDALHINAAGQEAWLAALATFMETLPRAGERDRSETTPR